MKKLIALALGSLLVAAQAQAAPVTYQLDPLHTAVTWSVSHFEFSKPWGKFSMLTGSLVFDEQKPENSSVTVTVPMASVYTGVAKLDEHLKTKDFFDVETYPEAKFVSRKVTQIDKEKRSAVLLGDLTLHGVTKPVSLSVTFNKAGENIFKKQTAGFSAEATVKRSDFGITTYLPGVGDEVKLYIEAEGNL